MTKERLYKVSEIAEIMKVSTTTIYKYIKRLKKDLKDCLVKEKGVNHYNQNGYEKIVAAMKETVVSAETNTLQTGFEVNLNSRLEGLEKAIMLLVESNKKLSEQNKELTATVVKQNNKLARIQMKLEKPGHKKIEAWQPKPKKQPNYSFLQKFWYELVSPEKLRAY